MSAQYAMCFVIDSPPRLDTVEGIKTEYMDDMKMDSDFYRVAEPQVDIIQTCDVQTQTEGTSEQHVLQKLHALENTINVLREDWRRDREMQNILMEKHTRKMLEHQKTLLDNFFAKTKSHLLKTKNKD